MPSPSSPTEPEVAAAGAPALPLTDSECTAHGIYRRKYHLRALCQSVALCLLVAGYALHREFVAPLAVETGTDAGDFPTLIPATTETGSLPFHHLHDDSISTNAFAQDSILDGSEKEQAFFEFPERFLEEIATTNLTNSTSACGNKADPAWMVVFPILGVIYMFLALAIACDEFFVPALEEMASERRLNLSMDVAGATLMAAGGSAPELFTSLIGTFQRSEIGFGTIVGSAVFNVLFVIAMCTIAAKETLTLTWWPLFRDSLCYAISLLVLAMFVKQSTPDIINVWEAAVLFSMYLMYILLMYFNAYLYRIITGQELQYPTDEDGEDGDDDDEDDDDPRAMSSGQDLEVEHSPPTTNGVSQSSLANLDLQSAVEPSRDHGRFSNPRWQGTFRAGILKLLRDPDSWLDTAGVGIVAKIAGDVDQVFKKVDLNGDGEIDKEELNKLFERLDCHLTSTELDDVFDQLDENSDGRISEQEFSKWYLRSEERILSQVKHVFDSFDVNHSNTIDRSELHQLLEKLEPRVTDQDVEEAINHMYRTGSRDEITFEEFSEWYKESLIYERQKRAVEEDMEGVWENLKPPCGEGFFTWVKYIVVLPLVLSMSLTVPDVQRPGNGKWCYLSFFMSIVWIGGFSYFMVAWAEIIGNTVGIPAFIMGLTILAAGTSVPDLLSSVIVARRGHGDMAVSSSIGSNIFDVLVGLPIPWLAFSIILEPVEIGSDGIWRSLLILVGMLVFVIIAIHCQGWKLTKLLGGLMLVFYLAYLAIAIGFEWPLKACT